MKHLSIRRVIGSQDVCGEGVLWHQKMKTVFWTDINRCLLHSYNFACQSLLTWHFDQPVTAVALTNDDDLLLIVLGGRIVLWSLSSEGIVSTLFTLPGWPSVRCNDARVAPNGALWFGTMENNVRPDGSTGTVQQWVGELYSLTSHSNARVWHSGIGITNTVAWSPDGATMYFGDTLRNCIYRCAFDAAKNLIKPPVLFHGGFDRGLPDGSAVDEEGFLWNCRYGGGCMIRITPDGSIAEVIDTPVKNPTTCTFGETDLSVLYFTSAGEDSASDSSDEGSLCSLDAGISGLPATPFRL